MASGQAMTEMLFILPLVIILGSGCLMVAYMCWQGIKVQAAANYAARIYGQERVAGGMTTADIAQDNGLVANGGQVGDDDPQASLQNPGRKVANLRKGQVPNGSKGAFSLMYREAKGLFSAFDQGNLFVPAPEHGPAGLMDTVKVTRVFDFQGSNVNIFGWKPNNVIIEGKAYGGEDPQMYGLPRWGRDSKNDPALFWRSHLTNTKKD